MRTLAAAVVAAASLAAPARAQPRVETCGVTFVRAPDDVRHEIERWLAAEPRCATSLDLRVIPTDGGLYLWAQRPDGRVHERMVPDAQTAGVLVASWAADDWVESTPPPVAPVIQVTPAPTPFVDAPPRVQVKADRWSGGQWISFGLASDDRGHDGGFRGSVDVLAVGAWRLGVVGQYSIGSVRGSMPYVVPDDYSQPYTTHVMGLHDAELGATLSRGITWGGWELGASLGVGVLRTTMQVTTTDMYGFSERSTSKSTTLIQASAMLTRRLGRSVGIGFGPVVTRIDQNLAGDQYAPLIPRRDLQVLWFGAVRYAM